MTLPPVRAIAYFQSKELTPTMSWKDMEDEAHAVEFAVAGITKLDVLSDIQNSLTRSLTEGMSFRQFQDELEPLLQRKGWLGCGLVADDDGVLQRGEYLLMVVEDLTGYSVVTLARSADGFEPVSSVPWSPAVVARASLIDGALPEGAA